MNGPGNSRDPILPKLVSIQNQPAGALSKTNYDWSQRHAMQLRRCDCMINAARARPIRNHPGVILRRSNPGAVDDLRRSEYLLKVTSSSFISVQGITHSRAASIHGHQEYGRYLNDGLVS